MILSRHLLPVLGLQQNLTFMLLLYSQDSSPSAWAAPSSLCPSQCAQNWSLGRDLASIPSISSSQPMSRAKHRCSPFSIPEPKDCQGLILSASSPVAGEGAAQHLRNLIHIHTGAFYRENSLQQAGPAARISVLESSPAQHCSLLPILQPQLHHWPSLSRLWHLTLLRLFMAIEKLLKFLFARALMESWELPRLCSEQEQISNTQSVGSFVGLGKSSGYCVCASPGNQRQEMIREKCCLKQALQWMVRQHLEDTFSLDLHKSSLLQLLQRPGQLCHQLCRDGGLHKTSPITSQSGLVGAPNLFTHSSIPFFNVWCKVFPRARTPGWRPKASSCRWCNFTLSPSFSFFLLISSTSVYRHFCTKSTFSSANTQLSWDER